MINLKSVCGVIALCLMAPLSHAGDGSIANKKSEMELEKSMDELIAEYYIQYGEATAAGPTSDSYSKSKKQLKIPSINTHSSMAAVERKKELFGSNN